MPHFSNSLCSNNRTVRGVCGPLTAWHIPLPACLFIRPSLLLCSCPQAVFWNTAQHSTVRSRFPAETRACSLLQTSTPALEPAHPPVQRFPLAGS